MSSESNVTRVVDAELCSLVHRFRDVLELRVKTLKCFADQGVQVEGWLKGEILAFLSEEKSAGRLRGFGREVPIQDSKCRADLTLDLRPKAEDPQIWIELKHYLIGFQKDIEYRAYDYFNDPARGIKPDVDKLLSIASPHRYALILMTRCPSLDDWDAAIKRFNDKFQPCLQPLTNPNDFCDEFFLGLVSVTKSEDQVTGEE
jgi:hypothetical protein